MKLSNKAYPNFKVGTQFKVAIGGLYSKVGDIVTLIENPGRTAKSGKFRLPSVRNGISKVQLDWNRLETYKAPVVLTLPTMTIASKGLTVCFHRDNYSNPVTKEEVNAAAECLNAIAKGVKGSKISTR